MVTAEAAYCSICGAYVFVGADGGCEHGHPRSALLAVYFAEVDKRTGLPRAPRPKTESRIAIAPVAPRVQPQITRAASVTTIGLPMHHTVASAVIWPEALTGLVDGAITRLLSPPKGKHSAAAGVHRTGRGRHSAVVVRDGRRAAVRATVITGSIAAGIAGVFAVL